MGFLGQKMMMKMGKDCVMSVGTETALYGWFMQGTNFPPTLGIVLFPNYSGDTPRACNRCTVGS